MRRAAICILIVLLITVPVSASELEAPPVSGAAAEYMPEISDTFGEALLRILQKTLPVLRPDLAEALQAGFSLVVMAMFLSILPKENDAIHSAASLAGIVFTCVSLLSGTNSLIGLGRNTVMELSEYSKLYYPVLSTALAANGAVTSSIALYSGTILFSTFLCSLVQSVLIPSVFLYLAAAVSGSAFEGEILKKMKEQLKKGIIWGLKTSLALFISYMGITGIVSGTTDASKMKVVRTAVSTAVPILGSTLANASDAILLSAGIIKNAAGLYGVYAMLAIFLAPFLRIGVHFIIMKAAAWICSIFDNRQITGLLEDFSSAMSILLAMTGAICLLHLISIFCFLKGGGM